MLHFQQIRLRETGTIAGIDRLTVVEGLDLSDKDSQRLDHAIEALRFFDLAEPGQTGVIADAAVFDLAITQNGTSYSVHFEMPPNNSVALRALLDLIRELGQGSAPTA